MYQKYFKRLFDIIISLSLIILLFPLMLAIFVCIWIFIGYPIFSQKRPGLNNKIFTLYKFKTLYDFPKNIPENQRQNKLGTFLRRMGLDELPQLFNILENKMSFVGPRPLLIKYLKIKAFKNHSRRKCLPGITGLAQVEIFNKRILKKRNSKWKDQFDLDKKYSKNISFKLDLLIISKTLLKFIISNKIDYHNETKLSSRNFK